MMAKEKPPITVVGDVGGRIAIIIVSIVQSFTHTSQYWWIIVVLTGYVSIKKHFCYSFFILLILFFCNNPPPSIFKCSMCVITESHHQRDPNHGPIKRSIISCILEYKMESVQLFNQKDPTVVFTDLQRLEKQENTKNVFKVRIAAFIKSSFKFSHGKIHRKYKKERG